MNLPRSTLLAAAFAALLLVIGISSTWLWWNAASAAESLARLREAHLEADAALDGVRRDVLQVAVLTRDYLLDPQEVRAQASYQERFTELQTLVDSNLQRLMDGADDDSEAVLFKQLGDAVNAYWERAEGVLHQDVVGRDRLQAVLLEFAENRDEVGALVAQLEDVMRANFLAEQQRTTEAGLQLRSSYGWTIIGALLLGAVISIVTLTRMVSLERQSSAAESELRRHSGQIRMAQEQERKSLSRELHDQVGQALTGLRMELGAITRLAGDGPEITLRLNHCKSTVEQLVGNIRDISMLLRPSMLDDLGLQAALNWMVKQTTRSSELVGTVNVAERADALPELYRTCLYRVVQEAVTNVVRHADARKINVTLETAGGWVDAWVEDDGRGFTPESNGRQGLGLLGMKERVKELGGTLEVTSSPGQGTRVAIHLPLPAGGEVTDANSDDRRRSRDRASGAQAPA